MPCSDGLTKKREVLDFLLFVLRNVKMFLCFHDEDESPARGQYRAPGLERGSLWIGRLFGGCLCCSLDVGFVVFPFGGLVPAAVLFSVPFAGEGFPQRLSLSLLFFLLSLSPHSFVERFSRFSHPPAPFGTISNV
jgi:hypothetical protein